MASVDEGRGAADGGRAGQRFEHVSCRNCAASVYLNLLSPLADVAGVAAGVAGAAALLESKNATNAGFFLVVLYRQAVRG